MYPIIREDSRLVNSEKQCIPLSIVPCPALRLTRYRSPHPFEKRHLHLSLFTISALFDPLLRQAMASELKVEECSDARSRWRCAFFVEDSASANGCSGCLGAGCSGREENCFQS